MNFSTNQVMQFYVVGNIADNITGAATLPTGGFSFNVDDEHRTDVIENVMWGKVVTADALKMPFTVAELTLKSDVNSGSPVAGENYVVRVSYPEVAGLGIEGWTTKTAVVTATTGMTAATLYSELGKNLEGALGTDGVIEVVLSTGKLAIAPADPTKNFKAGIYPVVMPEFRVSFAQITVDGVLESPFELEVGEADTTTYTDLTPISGAYKLADMEYFAMGERGDQYRKMGWPDFITTEYKINTANEYDMLVVHYAYKGANEGSYKSEKDLILAGTAANIDAVAKALQTKTGVTFTKVDVPATEGDEKETALA